MDKLFRLFSKGKKDEPKAKEEEDLVINQQKVKFEIQALKKDEVLDEIVKKLKVGGKQIDSYQNYIKNLDSLICQYKPEKTELEYRFSKANEKNLISNDNSKKEFYFLDPTNIDKMRLVGKIGESPTIFDLTSLHGELIYTYSKINNNNQISLKFSLSKVFQA